MTNRFVWLAILVSFLLTTHVAQADLVTVVASKDNTLIDSMTGNLSAALGPNLCVGRTAQLEFWRRRFLLQFNLSSGPGAISPGSTINSVSLKLEAVAARNGVFINTVSIHRVLKLWGEENSLPFGCAGDFTTAGDASWIHSISPTQAWSNPGGDFDPASSASQDITAPGNTYTWGPTVGMTQDVQAWVDNPNQNFGWIFIGGENVTGSAKAFSSLEGLNCDFNSICPRIEIDFTPNLVDVSDHVAGEGLRLTAIAPNPSPGISAVHFSMARSGPVQLTIFNIQGRHITTLVNAVLEAGPHVYEFRGLDKRGNLVMSGVYVARLEAAGEVKTKKFVLAR